MCSNLVCVLKLKIEGVTMSIKSAYIHIPFALGFVHIVILISTLLTNNQ